MKQKKQKKQNKKSAGSQPTARKRAKQRKTRKRQKKPPANEDFVFLQRGPVKYKLYVREMSAHQKRTHLKGPRPKQKVNQRKRGRKSMPSMT